MGKLTFKQKFQIIGGILIFLWIMALWSGHNWIAGLVAMCQGVCLVRFHKQIAQMMYPNMEKQFGFKEKDWYPKFNRVIIFTMGVFAIIFGFLMIIDFQPIVL
jgi:hypothetical protein